ncbi:MAG TPA: nuclear transport factor 2 family protein [Solirubrobacteraceae bacterium]|nr:nuclear transport factor 2 family protein [Solirubrobacteraceae bacterium]
MTTTHTFDLSTFKQAIEERDASAQLAMYADDAEVTLVDRVSRPSAPRVLRGREEIQAWIEDVCGRDMTHRVQHTVQDEDGAAFTEACRYPDGTGVVCATVLELDNGLVTRQIGVQAWDE